MSPSEIPFLTALVNIAHGTATFDHATEVHQVHHHVTLWTGTVAIFRLAGHPTATTCYAWFASENPALTSPIMFLNSPSISSPAGAVRAYVRQLCLELAA